MREKMCFTLKHPFSLQAVGAPVFQADSLEAGAEVRAPGHAIRRKEEA